MKTTRKVIHVVKHTPTGAKVPVIIKKTSKDNVIEDYEEYVEKRKGFSLAMLQNRWDKCREDVIELLQKYQVPAHVNHNEVKALSPDKQPIDVATFFEEYIIALEQKANLPHKKIKSKSPVKDTEH